MVIEGEYAYRVPSLTLPTSKSNLQIIQGSEAVRLFVERAAASQFNFELTERNAPFIAQICQRLDGIALAIELAASRVKMFQVEQIVARLDNSFDLLTGGRRTALPRHQTLRALIDWSYNLLSEEEKILLQRLSIFMGGWGLKAAEAVCGNVATFDLLAHLVDKSLVSVDREHGNEARYYLLETVRQYAHEKLVESEDIIHLRNLHLEYFLKTAELISPELYTRKMPFWLDYLETDYANFHTALEWAQERDIEAGLRLSNSLYPFWYIRGGGRKEGIQWFETYLTLSIAKQNTTRAWALFNYINLSSSVTLQKLSSTDKKYIEESLRLAQKLGDHACASRVLERYGIQEMIIGNFDSANSYLRQSLSEARLAGSDRLIGNATYRLGNVAYNRTDYQTARKFVEESVEIFRKVGDLSWWALALNLLGLMSNDQGDWNTARGYFDEALSLAVEARDRPYASVYLLNLGLIAFGLGDFDQGKFFLNQARELVQDTPDDLFLCALLKGLGEIARFQGDFDRTIAFYKDALVTQQWDTEKAMCYCLLADVERLRGQVTEARQHLLFGLQFVKAKADWAISAPYVIPYIAYLAMDQHEAKYVASLLGWVEGWYKEKGFVQRPIYQTEFDRCLAKAHKQLSKSEFNAAWAEGYSMNQEQILAVAMEVLQ